MWKCKRRFTASSSFLWSYGSLSTQLPKHIVVAKPIDLLHQRSIRLAQSPRFLRNPLSFNSCIFPLFSSSVSWSSSTKFPDSHSRHGAEDDDNDSIGNEDEDLYNNEEMDGSKCQKSTLTDFRDVETLMTILEESKTSRSVMKNKLELCGVTVTSELVVEVLSRVRNDWEAAFTFFLWASKQPGYAHSLREYHSMISILGKMRKFDTAWALIDEMRVRGGSTGTPLVTPQTLLIMIRKYCAVHDVAKAINTFYAYKRFKFEITIEDFQDLLSALCRYKNVKDAEYLLFCNKSVFPLNTKSFNIILNGWCNVVGDLREGMRIWREMKARGIPRDVFSYSSMMSCYSKFGNLKSLLKLFDQMKGLDIAPDRKVYNAVIHALSKGKHVKEARNLMKTMQENGISANAATYNSLIMPLCRTRQIDAAREIFNEMTEKGMPPTVRTYHAFFRILMTGEEVFALLQSMNVTGCQPGHDTYIMLIRKFCRWRQLDNVFKLWTEMRNNGLDHDRSSYIVLINGLFLNGKLEESYKYYLEMKKKHLLPEPKIEEMLQAWLAGKQNDGRQITHLKDSQEVPTKLENKARLKPKKLDGKRDFFHQPEGKMTTREHGFSFWKD
ncbi:unnamed protein product [Coffea canephora]|uniref:DH200=94 genomic scaffold, scaffold_2366 n=1 Tax=Coffea canephora TaxID=49390 RepID=A0A068VMY6_COFCA|nr:unnamed protein product [Coffea canephora]